MNAFSDRVVSTETGRVRVVMEWEVDAVFETTQSGRFTCSGWLQDPTAIVKECRTTECRELSITRVDV